MNAFSPFLRTHDGIVPGVNSQFYSDPEKYRVSFQEYTPLYLNIERQYLKKPTKRLPSYKTLYAHYEQDKTTFKEKYQYLFGRDMLVAPVVEKATNLESLPTEKDIIGSTFGAARPKVDSILRSS